MDQAIYASAASVIIGIRGNRVFQCNPLTGAIQIQADLGTFGRNGCLAYDAGSNKVFAAVWNTPSYALSGGSQVSNRNLYRINPATLAVEVTTDIVTAFGLASNNLCGPDAGICAMDSSGGNIFCRYYVCHTPLVGGSGGSLKFSAGNIGTFALDSAGVLGGAPVLVYGSVGGHDNAIYCDQEGGPEVVLFDYAATAESTFAVASPKNMLAVGFDPTNQIVFVTDVSQKVYVYNPAGALQCTVDTTHSAFNGVAVRRGSDGLIYVVGGNDNTVLQMNPATVVGNHVVGSPGGPVLISGFDCPVDLVFAGATRFAVQAGAVPLKAF